MPTIVNIAANVKNTSLGSLKQIDAGILNFGYPEAGPANGPAVIFLRGWPYDVHSYVDVAPSLASAAHRVIVPYLRSYGTTRFLSSETFRNGQQWAAVALDIIVLIYALKIEKAIIGSVWTDFLRCVSAVKASEFSDFSPRSLPHGQNKRIDARTTPKSVARI